MTTTGSSSFLVLMVVASDKLVNSILYSYNPQKNGGLGVVCVGESQKWDADKEDDFETVVVNSTDVCLSKIDVKQRRDISKLIFMVSPFWTINSEKIIDSKQELLREICHRYNLKPSGFIVDDEAMIRHYASEDGSLPSFISIFSGPGELRISLIHLGKVRGRIKLNIDGQLTAQKVKEGLSQLDFDGVMPPQISIWGEVEDDFEQQMNNYPWVEKQGDLFLHLPEVVILSWAEAARAYSTIINDRLTEENGEENRLKPVVEKESESEKSLPFGFSSQDAFNQEAEINLDSEPMMKVTQEAIREPIISNYENMTSEIITDGKTDNRSIGNIKRRLFFSSLLSKIKFGGFAKFRPTLLKKLKTKLFLLLGLGLAGFIGFNLFLSKTNIDIYVTPQTVEESLAVELKKGGFLSVSEKTIPTDIVTAEKEDGGSVIATGIKLIGERASGKVTVYNRTDKQATFEKGTIISSLGALEFSLEEGIKVASKTPDLVSGVDRWGEAEAAVMAVDIGGDYNLAKETSFIIKGEPESSYLAKNKSSFSGGTSREVLAVSKDDFNSLKKELSLKMEDDIKAELLSQISDDDRMIEETLVVEIASFDTNKNIGDEGDVLEGSLKISASVLVFSKNDIDIFAQEILREKLDSGLKINPESFKFSFVPKSSKDGTWEGDLEVNGKAYPNIDVEGIKGAIRGKRKEIADEKIKSLPRVYDFQISTWPKLFNFWPLTSLSPGNILINIKE